MIPAAGAMKSPQLPGLSVIGRPDVPQQAGIPGAHEINQRAGFLRPPLFTSFRTWTTKPAMFGQTTRIMKITKPCEGVVMVRA